MPILAIVHSPIPTIRHGLLAMLGEDPAIEAIEPGRLSDGSDLVGSTVDIVHFGVLGSVPLDDSLLDESSAAVLVLENDPVDLPELSRMPIALVPVDSDSATLVAATHAVANGLSAVDWRLAQSAGISLRIPVNRLSEDDELLTPREHEVIELVSQGLPNKAIAAALGISEHTVKFHMGSLMGKLGAESRTEAVTTATRRGILTI